jgi:hypothetical protein
MGSGDPQSVFLGHLDDTIERYGRDRNRHKRRALVLKMSTSALGAGATVLLGWQDPGSYAVVLKNAALVLTSLVTLFAAYDAFFEPRKLWVRETYIFNSLRDLKREWEVDAAAGHGDPAKAAEYSKRFHDILAESLKEWMDGKKNP